MLIEQPGPWGSDAPLESRLDPQLGAALSARAKQLGLKLLLITRSDRRDARDHTVFLVRPDAGRIEERTIASLAELLEPPLAEPFSTALERLASGEHPEWGAVRDDPLYLVCTNGRRDACCALYGRPLVTALSSDSPHVWESSHIGGHRFAGNLVCLPEALIYGRVTPDHGRELVAAHAQGRLDVRSLRGRAAWPVAAQAAEIQLRLHLGLDRIAEVTLAGVRSSAAGGAASVAAAGVAAAGVAAADGGDEHVVELLARGERWRLRLRATPAEPPRATSCRADKLERPLRWDLVSMDRG